MTLDRLMKFNPKRLKALKTQTQKLEKKTQEDLTIYHGNLETIEQAIEQKAGDG